MGKLYVNWKKFGRISWWKNWSQLLFWRITLIFFPLFFLSLIVIFKIHSAYFTLISFWTPELFLNLLLSSCLLCLSLTFYVAFALWKLLCIIYYKDIIYNSAQFSCSVVSNSLWSHESQHARPPYPSPTPGVHSNSRPSSRWCHPAISSSVVPFFYP